MEEENLYKLGDLGPKGISVLNNNVYEVAVTKYFCPSDPTIGDGYVPGYGAWWTMCSYGVNFQVFGNPSAGDDYYHNSLGASRLGESFADGTSSTILYGEKYGACGGTGQPGTPLGTPANSPAFTLWAAGYWQFYMAMFGYGSADGKNPYCQENQDAPFTVATRCGEVGSTSKFQLMPSSDECDFARAQTPHPGGMNVCMADGSVHVISANINPKIWWALCTPNGAEVIPDY